MKPAVLAHVLALSCLGAGCSAEWRAERLDRAGRREYQPERAIDDFTQAIELAPVRADFWLDRGDARLAQGDADGAIADYTEALRIQADAPTLTETRAPTLVRRARARRMKMLLDLAEQDLAKALELDPSSREAVERERATIEQARGK
jgi:tetratricopeptide (TPR) repeat protein